MHELKCFWQFYQKQAKGLLFKHPTINTLKNRIKQLNSGLHRYTKQHLEGTTVSEINHILSLNIQGHLTLISNIVLEKAYAI